MTKTTVEMLDLYARVRSIEQAGQEETWEARKSNKSPRERTAAQKVGLRLTPSPSRVPDLSPNDSCSQ